ncbi:VanW family protein [Bacillus sp. BRMEA1]|uniref:VanW family protein n=1 Tax=Neobacillus endophyticus TaxID=2738405 RepID=UPI001564A221|nr:VanW family protein [Neobacillus endophyticus]NRD80356.1 VanW family protein [Neobacillus endophyticus]
MMFSWLFGIWLSAQQIHSPANITITKDGIPITTLNRAELFNPYIDLPILNPKKMEGFLNQLNKQISTPTEDAKIDKHGNIIPEKVGFQLNQQDLTEQFYRSFYNPNRASLEIQLVPVYPKVDGELLSYIRIKRIGSYVTSFNPQNKNRTNNIQLASDAINNSVVFPGEKFSFNKTVGKRTAGKGYLRAPVIQRGEFSEDIGGGICQVSSTLFNAVDNAGLKIVQRFSHSRSVSYIPPGRDATVSWYGPDFEFKNEYNQPILIRARTLGHLLIIKLYSSDSIQYIPRKVPNPPIY